VYAHVRSLNAKPLVYMSPDSSHQAVLDRTAKQLVGIDMYFDLVDIRLFENIAQTNSLTHGAEHSHVSVPAASARIKNIEDRLGTKLLYRTRQGVTLTPAGQTFLHHGRLVLRQLEHLWGDLQEYTQGVKGHVRIFANTTAISEFLPSVLGEYLSNHPDVNVDLREHLSPDIVRAVREGATDIGIAAGTVSTEGLEVLDYRRDRLVLVTALTHPVSRRRIIPFDSTLEFDYVSLLEASAIHGFITQAAKHKPLRIRIQVGNFEALCRMVERNVGVGIIPESVARRHVKTMAIRIIPLSDVWAERNLQICVRSFKLLPAFARELIDLLISDRTSDAISPGLRKNRT
jgi:DNA-binding transcriptional LysR family regulator